MKTDAATLKRVYAMSFAGVYPHYIAKAEKRVERPADGEDPPQDFNWPLIGKAGQQSTATTLGVRDGSRAAGARLPHAS